MWQQPPPSSHSKHFDLHSPALSPTTRSDTPLTPFQRNAAAATISRAARSAKASHHDHLSLAFEHSAKRSTLYQPCDEAGDDDILRCIGLYLPVVEDAQRKAPTDERSPLTALEKQDGTRPVQIGANLTSNLSGPPCVVIEGSKCSFQVWYHSSVPSSVKPAYESSLRSWASHFPCALPIRFICYWSVIQGATLGATVTPFYVPGNIAGAKKLDPNTLYGGPIAMAIEGTDFVPSNEAHVVQVFNSDVSWNFDTTRGAGSTQWDFATVALHEQCHGLFFSGVIESHAAGIADISPAFLGKPARFDRFVALSSASGVVESCNTSSALYSALTNKALRWEDPSVPNSNYSLFSPSPYQTGSSVYHHDPSRLSADCLQNQVSKADCSDLMTQELLNGYTQHNIGVPVLAMMHTMLASSSNGMGAGGCDVVPNASPSGGLGGLIRLTLPIWAIYAIAGVGAFFLVIVTIAIIASSIWRKK